MKVIKRDGRKVDFNKEKIFNAICKAFISKNKDVDNEAIKKITDEITVKLEKLNQEDIDIEYIQDRVEDSLMSAGYNDIAKEYILYRDHRTIERTKNSTLRKKTRSKLTADNVKNQNANVDEYSFGGRMGEANAVQMRDIALNEIMSPLAAENHKNNIIYTHDLDHYAVGDHNCLSVPFDDLLANGFATRQTDVRPAQSISTALQLVAVIFQLQSLQQFGGVSATHLDHTLERYVRKSFLKHYIVAYLKKTNKFLEMDLMDILFDTYEDEVGVIRNKFDDFIDEFKVEFFDEVGLKEEDFIFDNKDKLNSELYQSALFDTINETKQAVEGMYHNLNTLQSRSGNQLPFTSINYGTCTSPEGRLVIKALLDGSIKGVGRLHKTSIFPCGIFQYMKGVNDKPGTPNYDLKRLALKSTARRLYPNYANVDWSGNKGYDINDPTTYFSTMGKCKLQLI